MPPPAPPVETDSSEVRRGNREQKEAALETEVVPTPVPPEQRVCPHCENGELRTVGDGKPSVIYDYVAAHFRKRVHLRETLACSCGQYVVTAPPPERVGNKTQYGAGFIAHLIVSKCADCRAQYNLAKEYQRVGIPMSRSTINALFHRAADILAPLVERLFERIAATDLVLADETTMRMQREQKKAFIWTFITDDLIGYRFSCNRSGATPRAVLGDSEGTLVCDAYTGYNRITSTGRRRRGGCLAHARRKVFDAQDFPEATAALELIGEIYVVEREAQTLEIVGTPAHAQLRRDKSRSLFARLLWWAREQKRAHAPKTLLGKAARYIISNYRPLGLFLRDVNVPLDNNASEAALRRVALGRRVFLFVGHEDAGHRLAILYTLVASCEHNGVNPVAYLTDVLTRIDHHPNSRIDELLPDAWTPR